MPQLDKLTFIAQLFWLLPSLAFIYYMLLKWILPSIAITLKIRYRLTQKLLQFENNFKNER